MGWNTAWDQYDQATVDAVRRYGSDVFKCTSAVTNSAQAWDSRSAYSVGACVKYGDYRYRCISNVSSKEAYTEYEWNSWYVYGVSGAQVLSGSCSNVGAFNTNSYDDKAIISLPADGGSCEVRVSITETWTDTYKLQAVMGHVDAENSVDLSTLDLNIQYLNSSLSVIGTDTERGFSGTADTWYEEYASSNVKYIDFGFVNNDSDAAASIEVYRVHISTQKRSTITVTPDPNSNPTVATSNWTKQTNTIPPLDPTHWQKLTGGGFGGNF